MITVDLKARNYKNNHWQFWKQFRRFCHEHGIELDFAQNSTSLVLVNGTVADIHIINIAFEHASCLKFEVKDN